MEIQKEYDESALINAEHAWIAKYREAVNNIPPKQSALAKIRAALESGWRAAKARIGRTVEKQRLKTESPGEARSSGVHLEKSVKRQLERKPAIKAHPRNSVTKSRRRRRAG